MIGMSEVDPLVIPNAVFGIACPEHAEGRNPHHLPNSNGFPLFDKLLTGSSNCLRFQGCLQCHS